MVNYKYILEPYKGQNTRYTCPSCGHKKVFVRYIDTETGEHLGEDIGRCGREVKCGYHKKPNSNGIAIKPLPTFIKKEEPTPLDYDLNISEADLVAEIVSTNLYAALLLYFDSKVLFEAMKKYHVRKDHTKWNELHYSCK